MNDQQIRTETEPTEVTDAQERVPPEDDPAEDAEETQLRAEERIRELEEELRRVRTESDLREKRLFCIHQLQSRGIRQEAAELIVAGDAEIPEEEILHRVELLAEAVEEAAVRQLRSRAVSMTPRCGTEPLLTGDLIRQTPVARLAEMMGK